MADCVIWIAKKIHFILICFDQTNPHSISNDGGACYLRRRRGILWLGTFGGGINTYDPKKQRFAHYHHDPRNSNSLSDPIIWAITQGPDDDVWFGTNTTAVDRYNYNTGRYLHYGADPGDPFRKTYVYVRSLRWDDTGKLWIGHRNGVAHFDPGNNSYTHYRHQPENPNSLCNDLVRTIIQDRFGGMWFCTWVGGSITTIEQPARSQTSAISRTRPTVSVMTT